MKDKIIDEIRSVRKKLDKETGKNPKKFANHIDSIREKYKERLVTLGPKIRKKHAA
jgi:hypothetical protein